MRNGKRTIVVLVSLAIAISTLVSVSSFALASQDDSWSMFRHDMERSGSATGSGTTNAGRLLWNYSVHASVLSSPAVDSGIVVVGCKDYRIYGINSTTGVSPWEYLTGAEVNSSPAVSNGFVYVGSDDGKVYCLNVTAGNKIWTRELGGQVRSSPAVVGDRVYVGGGLHDMYCLNSSDGSVNWIFPTQFAVWSSPSVSDGVVYFACDDFFIYAVNSTTGELIWSNHIGCNLNSPAVSDGRVYIGSYDGTVFALDALTGAEAWRFQTSDSIASSPAIAYGRVYIGSEDNSLHCLNATDGTKLWQTATGYWIWSSPAVADGNVYVGSEDYNIYCMDAFSGAVKWSFATQNIVDSSPAIADGALYVCSSDHFVYALNLYNSSTDSTTTSTSSSLNWSTIVFDAIFCVVLAFIAFKTMVFVWSKRSVNVFTETAGIKRKVTCWFSANIDAVCILCILVFSSTYFVNLQNGTLWSADEQTYSQMAYYMIKTGDYLKPHAFGELAILAGKPPLVMWIMSITYQVFGVNNFATRVWSPVFGALSLVLVFYLGKKLYNSYVGLLTAIVLGTFTTFYAFATHAMTDGPLVFFIIGSIYFMILSEESKKATRYAALSGLFFGLALMTKQIEALLIPLIIFFYFVFTRQDALALFRRQLHNFWKYTLLVFGPWLIYMTLWFRLEFWNCYFIYCDVLRAVTPIEGHAGGPLFYFNYIAYNENLLWVVLLPLALGFCVFNLVRERSKKEALVLVWMAVVLGVFTLAQTKLYWYILPALPAFAIAVASFIFQLFDKARTHFRHNPVSLED